MGSESWTRPPRHSDTARQQMPVPVETLLQFNYPKHIVVSTYQKLLSECSNATHHHVNHEAEGAAAGASGGAPIPNTITAVSLLTAVEEVLRRAPSSERVNPHRDRRRSASAGDTATGPQFGADEDVEGDGPGDDPEMPSPSSRNNHEMLTSSPNLSSAPGRHPGDRNAAPSTSGTMKTSTTTSSASTTAGVFSSASSAVPNTTIPSGGAAAPVESSSSPTADTSSASNGAVSASTSTSGQPSFLATPTHVSEPSTHQHPPESQMATASTPSTAVSVSESAERARESTLNAERATEGTPSAERARERSRVMTRLRALREENRRLKDRQMCRRCRQRPVGLTFLPCGHFICCQTCGSAVQSCPACRKTILADVKTFLS